MLLQLQDLLLTMNISSNDFDIMKSAKQNAWLRCFPDTQDCSLIVVVVSGMQLTIA